MQHRSSAPRAHAWPPLHAVLRPMQTPHGGVSALCPPALENSVNGNPSSVLPDVMPEQLSGDSLAADEGENVAQAAAGTAEQGTFPVGEGYFSNFLNEENQNLYLMTSENVNKFCGCVARIEDRRQSGVTFQDKLVQALTLFKSEDNDNKSFQFMYCWNQLQNQPKWQEKRRRIDAIKQASNKKLKVNMNSSSGTATSVIPDSSQNDIPENASPEEGAPKKPIGKKKAKEALRQEMQGEVYKEASEHFWEKKRV
ncbi:hypothetical protein U9M48_021005 [Paspalum notatum var. saurae]|uniref:No apical meristem-associated C-terminal domain-containing protein n=1 Tax=Paspalum notatum var. saurae TaxID=547442 RepID=A0AAQ3TFX7_PASNO